MGWRNKTQNEGQSEVLVFGVILVCRIVGLTVIEFIQSDRSWERVWPKVSVCQATSVHAFALFIKTQYFFCFIIGLNLITVAISLTDRILEPSLVCVISRKESASAVMFMMSSTLTFLEEKKKTSTAFSYSNRVAYCLQT